MSDGTHYNIIALQRAMAVKVAGLEARGLLRDGYGVDCDRLLDKTMERIDAWREDGQAE